MVWQYESSRYVVGGAAWLKYLCQVIFSFTFFISFICNLYKLSDFSGAGHLATKLYLWKIYEPDNSFVDDRVK